MDKIKEYISKNRNKAYALNSWVALKNKSFNVYKALDVIYNAANGNFNEMNNMIDALTAKKHVQFRGQVYNDAGNDLIDIIPNENGQLNLVGYNKSNQRVKSKPENPNPKIYKNNGQLTTNYRNAETKITDIGKIIRTAYPTASKEEILRMLGAIRYYSIVSHYNIVKVANDFVNGKLKLILSDNGRWTLKGNNVRECKKIIFNENKLSLFESIDEEVTYYSFLSHIKSFLKGLLENPSSAKPDSLLLSKGLNRNKLIDLLLRRGIITRDESIDDKNEENNVSYLVKYNIPKKNFDKKIKRLYTKIFEVNVPQVKENHQIVNDENIDAIKDNFLPPSSNKVNEDGEAGMGGATNASSSGQFSQPVFPMQRRKIYLPKSMQEATATSTVGNYQYDVPFSIAKNDPTLSRDRELSIGYAKWNKNTK